MRPSKQIQIQTCSIPSSFPYLSHIFSPSRCPRRNHSDQCNSPGQRPRSQPFIPPSKSHIYASFFCSLIEIYLTCARFYQAAEAFARMRSFGLNPPLRSWNRLLFKFNSSGFVPQVPVVYSELLICRKKVNVFSHNVMIHALCKMGSLEKAVQLLRELEETDSVSYNTVMWGFCEYGMVESAVSFLAEMIKKGVGFDTISCNILVKGFCREGKLDDAESLMDMLGAGGVTRDPFGFNTLIDGYCKLGSVGAATGLLEMMKDDEIFPDIVTYNTLISGFCRIEEFDLAKNLVDLKGESLESNVVTYTPFISAYCDHGWVEEAFFLSEEMVTRGILPDVVAYTSLMNGLCKGGDLSKGYALFREMEKVGK